jgi:hypothetical protein
VAGLYRGRLVRRITINCYGCQNSWAAPIIQAMKRMMALTKISN